MPDDLRRWPGATVVIMASGPSMTQEDADLVKKACLPSDGAVRAIVVNSTFRLAAWADVCYTNDDDWCALHLNELRDYFVGQIWCGHPTWRNLYVHPIPYVRECPGLCVDPDRIAWGMNSGGAAIDLAVHFGAARIILLGYDQQWRGREARWHGAHPFPLQNQKPGFLRWSTWFMRASADLQRRGIDCMNASRETSLRAFRRVPLEDALRATGAQLQPQKGAA